MTLQTGIDTLEAAIRNFESFNRLDAPPEKMAELEEECRRDPRWAARLAGARQLVADLRALRDVPEIAELNALGEFVFNGTDEDAITEVIDRWHDHIENISHSLLEIGRRPPPARQYLQDLIAFAYEAMPAARRRTRSARR